jgi:hypothetical protein
VALLPDFGQHLRLIYVDIRRIGGPKSFYRRVQALFDGGCSRTFINDELAAQLKIPMAKFHLTINGFHGPQNELVAQVDFEGGTSRRWRSTILQGTQRLFPP